MENDLVSWLPPRHPKSIKSLSAARLREKKKLAQENDHKNEKGSDKDNDNDSDDDDGKGHHRHDKRDKDRDRDREDRRHRRDDRHGRRKRRDDIIDPMDPAAYSDIPQGTWSDGLENNKGRADSTASGPLYQQRPYPAPGEVLASNKEKNKKK